MRLQINRGLDGKFTKLKDMLEGYPEEYASRMAVELVSHSPVDTGAYMESFYVGSGYTNIGSSSAGRARKQNWQTYADKALSRMNSGISGLLNSSSMVFGNGAPHAFDVEYEHGYAPFGKAAREHKRIAKEAAQAVKARL